MIFEGRLSGVGQEPQWEEHLEQVLIPPKVRSTPQGSLGRSDDTGSAFRNGNLLEMLIIQNQQRMDAESKINEIFQTTLTHVKYLRYPAKVLKSTLSGVSWPNNLLIVTLLGDGKNSPMNNLFIYVKKMCSVYF